MTNEELKKKIVKIIRNMDSESDTLDAITLGNIMRIADALIAAGIGDVSKLQKECDSKEDAYNKCYFDYKHWKDKAKEYKHLAENASLRRKRNEKTLSRLP